MFKKFLSGYFSFTRKERTGILVILLLILIFTLLPFLFPYFFPQKRQDTTAFEKAISTIKYRQADSSAKPLQNNYRQNNYRRDYSSGKSDYYGKQSAGELFYFDPNTLSADGWKRLGIRDKTIGTILKYISKGGRFRQPEDIGKIWGLHEDEIQRLIPYVAIKPEESPAYADKNNTRNKYNDRPGYIAKPIDINTADTSAFIALPGIGSRLANRIVNFRDKLGGFYKVEQVAETYALPDSTFQKIKARLILNNSTVKQININTATVDALKIHPYIRFNLANAIVQYRTQHGNFTRVSDIKKIMMITDEIYDKLVPYLSAD